MATPTEIDRLLAAPLTDSVANQLLHWVEQVRTQISRGDMLIGILSMDEVAKIPKALEKAAEFLPDAWLTLAWWQARPDFGPPDTAAAEKALARAIAAGVEDAAFERTKLRWFFRREEATAAEQDESYRTAAERFQANPQDGEACYFQALLTTGGFGTPASPEKGYALQLQAADLGNSSAMFELYIHHATGLGVPQDEAVAFAACQRAADAGHARAMYNLGAFHASGRGVPKNIPQAIQWYERAADAGNPSALIGLAVIYAMGDGVEPDRAYAEQLFDQADFCGLDVSQIREQVGL